VDDDGSDGYTCEQAQTESTPMATIDSALACVGFSAGAGANDVVIVKSGTYTEIVDPFPGGTDWSNVFTLRVESGGAVVMQNGQRSFHVDGANERYIVIDGFECNGLGTGTECVKVTGDAAYVRMQNLEVHNYNNSGILCNRQYACEVYDSEMYDIGSHAIYFSAPDQLVDGLEAYDIGRTAVQLYKSGGPSADRCTIRNSVIRDTHSVAIIIQGSSSKAYNNVIYNAANDGIRVAFGTPTGVEIFNNTVYGVVGGAGIHLMAGSGTHVANNIAYGNATDYDDDDGSPTTLTTNLFGTDPLFVDPAADDYRIPETSPAVDAGTDLSPDITDDYFGTARPQGSAYDIGYHEVLTTTGIVCGDGIIEGTEECDGTTVPCAEGDSGCIFGGETCVSLGFDGGTLVCNADCTIAVGGCFVSQVSSKTQGVKKHGSKKQ
jgi:hypothetical protein